MLKNVWQMMMRDKLFSGIYIFGTALALATCTSFAILMYLKVAPVYPEYNRARTAYATSANVASKTDSSRSISLMSYDLVRDLFMKMKNVEIVSATASDWGEHFVQSDMGDIKVTIKPTDCNFFKIYDFDFLAGAPFSQADFDSRLRSAVITDKLARKVFGPKDPEELIGKTVSLDFKEYRIAGVVRQGNATETCSFGHIFFPYTSREGWGSPDSNSRPWLGDYNVVMLTDNIEGAKAEVAAFADRYTNSQNDYELYMYSQPVDIYQMAFSSAQDDEFSLAEKIWSGLGLLLVLMLVPALNLSGIISGRMESRLSEMGVRKSFGATRGRLLGQVLSENFILTLAGAIIGLIFAFILLKSGFTDLFVEGDPDESEITNEMIFAPVIFLFLFLLTFILNLLSALIPAYRSLRRPIVESLKEK